MAHEVSEKTWRPQGAHLHGRVLVVDDDEHFRVLARSILEPAGFHVLESAGTEDCLAQLRREPVDAVVLDMVMPGRDGLEALRDLRKYFPHVRIVAVSGTEQSELYLSVSAHLGADASLEKARIGALCPLLQVVLDQ